MISNAALARIVFFQVKKNRDKILKIAQIADEHFEKKEHLLILVENEAAAKYLDEQLWKEPIESFLPHKISDISTNEYLIITSKDENVNKARYIFNLKPTGISFEDPCRVIYEFEDATSQQKAEISAQKYKTYRAKGHFIESR